MRISTTVLLLGLAGGTLSACAPQPGQGAFLDSQSGRAIAGAVVGAGLADATDENVALGAALGAGAGALTCGVPGLPACTGL